MRTIKHRWLLLAGVALLICCGDSDGGDPNAPITPIVDGGGSPTDSSTTPPTDARVDGGPVRLSSCVDRPTDIPRPPTGRLPCELLPPGLTL